MDKIVILVGSPFTRRDYDRFGVEILDKYFVVEVFDFTPLINPECLEIRHGTVYIFGGYRTISSYWDFKVKLAPEKIELVLDYLPETSIARNIRSELRKRGVRRAIVVSGLLLRPPPKALLERVWALKYRKQKLKLVTSWLVRSLFSLARQRNVAPDVAVMTGTTSVEVPETHKAKQIWAHTFDYDVHLRLPELSDRKSHNYAVYLDSDPAFHSDFFALGMTPPVRAEKFYPALMCFFETFEKATGIEVVIAAHPRAQWNSRLHLLEGRTPIYGRTADLVHGADVVFDHVSTSISFAVLSRVPIVMLTSDEMSNSSFSDEIQLRSKFFRCPLINIDHPVENTLELAASKKIDIAAYDEYREKYIKKSGSPNLPLWEIFAMSILGEEK